MAAINVRSKDLIVLRGFKYIWNEFGIKGGLILIRYLIAEIGVWEIMKLVWILFSITRNDHDFFSLSSISTHYLREPASHYETAKIWSRSDYKPGQSRRLFWANNLYKTVLKLSTRLLNKNFQKITPCHGENTFICKSGSTQGRI